MRTPIREIAAVKRRALIGSPDFVVAEKTLRNGITPSTAMACSRRGAPAGGEGGGAGFGATGLYARRSLNRETNIAYRHLSGILRAIFNGFLIEVNGRRYNAGFYNNAY